MGIVLPPRKSSRLAESALSSGESTTGDSSQQSQNSQRSQRSVVYLHAATGCYSIPIYIIRLSIYFCCARCSTPFFYSTTTDILVAVSMLYKCALFFNSICAYFQNVHTLKCSSNMLKLCDNLLGFRREICRNFLHLLGTFLIIIQTILTRNVRKLSKSKP